MKKIILILVLALAFSAKALATPSTQIWIPSTDIQKFKTFHLNIDSYIRLTDEDNGTRNAPIFVLGPTVGILPFDKIQAEVGFDLIYQGNANLDEHPLYFHGKIGTPEESLWTWSPAIAVGIYNVGIKSNLTTQDIAYALAAKTIPVIGRLSAGYFYGNSTVLVNENGNDANHGLLLSWDRTLTEISDKLWMAADYQGSDSALGSVNFGASWAFSDNASLILGYDVYLNHAAAGKNTATVQVDVNF